MQEGMIHMRTGYSMQEMSIISILIHTVVLQVWVEILTGCFLWPGNKLILDWWNCMVVFINI